MLAELHRAPVGTDLRRGLDVPARDQLVAALDAVDTPWEAGPLSEAARLALAPHVSTIFGWLKELDDLTASTSDSAHQVVTHGEPHPGNVLSTASGLVLVDWDTCLLAPFHNRSIHKIDFGLPLGEHILQHAGTVLSGSVRASLHHFAGISVQLDSQGFRHCLPFANQIFEEFAGGREASSRAMVKEG